MKFDRWRTQTKFLAGFQHGHSGLPVFVGVLGTRTLCGKIMRTSGPTEYFYNAWMTAQNMYVLGHLGMIERSTGQNSRNFTNRNSRDSIEGYHLFGGKFSRLPWESEIGFNAYCMESVIVYSFDSHRSFMYDWASWVLLSVYFQSTLIVMYKITVCSKYLKIGRFYSRNSHSFFWSGSLLA